MIPETGARIGPFRIPARHRARLHSRRLVPLVVWTVVLIGAVGLHHRQEGTAPVAGFAEAVRVGVAPLAAGWLEQLQVSLHQDVFRGQVVALLDDEELLLQVREAREELDRLASELGRERALWELDVAGQQVDQQTNLRRFARDAEIAHVDYLDALADLAERRIEQQGLELTLQRTRELHRNDLTPLATLDEDRIALQALDEWIADQELRVESMLTMHRDAQARYREFLDEYAVETPGADLLLEPLEHAARIQEVRIERLNLAIVRRVLRAPRDGRVVEIHRREGEVVAAGEPVLSILVPRATEVVAYLPERQALDVEAGAAVKLLRVADPRQTFESSVGHLGSSVERMPGRVDPAALSPAWGVSVHISLPESPVVRPGEAFEVFFPR
ncbi:HlyD family secretion protein [bacterium]|nr:HlyD family secretion protein [bacterium]